MELNEQEKRVLADVVKRLRQELGATEILLYGSAARGELTAESDIDVMVVLPAVDWELKRRATALCFEAELEISRIISATCFTADELRNSPLRSSPLVLNALREGLPL